MTTFPRQTIHRTAAPSAFLAALLAAVTACGVLIAITLGPMIVADGSDSARLDRAVAAGRAWQRQRLIESPAYYERLHAVELAGLAWQLR